MQDFLRGASLQISTSHSCCALTLVTSFRPTTSIFQSYCHCSVIQLALSLPHTLILSFANSLAWNSRCLPIKTFSAECWHLEINRKALDRQLILISPCSEFRLQFAFKMSIHTTSTEICQTCSPANKKTTSHFACQTAALIGSEISQHIKSY